MMGFLFVNFWGRNPLSFGRSWIMSRQAVGEGGRIGGGGLVEVEVEGEGTKDWSIFLKGAKLVCCCCQGRGVYGKASQWIEWVVFGEMDFQSRESVIDQTTH